MDFTLLAEHPLYVATGALYRDGAFVDGGRAWVFYGCPDAGI